MSDPVVDATTAAAAEPAGQATNSGAEVSEDTIQLHTLSWDADTRQQYASYVSSVEQRSSPDSVSVGAAAAANYPANKRQKTVHAPSIHTELIVTNATVYITTPHGSHFGIVGQTKKEKQARIHKVYSSLSDCIGFPYGTSFSIDASGKCTPVEAEATPAAEQADTADDSTVDSSTLKAALELVDRTKTSDPNFQPTRNNADISNQIGVEPTTSAQTLSYEQVEALKAEYGHVRGAEIVRQLVLNSSTWHQKTEYSQEKYIKRKQKKWLKQFTVYKPTLQHLQHMFYNKESKRINGLRIDGLAYMLNLANCRAETNTLVFDSYAGLLTTACVVRHGGYGSIVNVYEGTFPRLELIKKLDLSEHATRNVCSLPMSEVGALQVSDHASNGDAPRAAADSQASTTVPRQQQIAAAKSLLQHQRIDSMLIDTKFHPLPVLQQLLPFMQPSGAFVIHCTSVEPLVQTYEWCKYVLNKHTDANISSNASTSASPASTASPTTLSSLHTAVPASLHGVEVINLEIVDSWMREYQVLPNRTHPDVNMTAGTGFILSGIKAVVK